MNDNKNILTMAVMHSERYCTLKWWTIYKHHSDVKDKKNTKTHKLVKIAQFQ